MLARVFAYLALVCALAGLPQPLVAQEQITVFAAASLKNALDDVNTAFTKAAGIKVVTSYEASSALATQIEAGAPADVFVSADLRWMDYAAERKLIDPNARTSWRQTVYFTPARSIASAGDISTAASRSNPRSWCMVL